MLQLDIDHPVDPAVRQLQLAGTHTRAFLEEAGVPQLLVAQGIS